MQISQKARQYVYIAMFLVNAAALAAVQQGALPPTWAHGALMVSLVAATLMKEFGAPDPAPQGPSKLLPPGGQ